MTFYDLDIGDMFNTITARWVKIEEYKAICVMSGVYKVGTIKESNWFGDTTLVVLYSENKE